VLEAALEQATRARRLGGRATPARHLVVLVDETDGRQPGVLEPTEAGVRLSELGVSVIRLVTDRLEEPE
jgi:hypothetical protein